MRLALLRVFAPAALVLAACGGKVVVDGGGGGYVGGSGGGSGGTASNWTGYCMGAPDMTALTFCGTGGGGTGGGACIENDFCDASGNVWSAVCNSQACACQLNGKTVCVCQLSAAGDFCTSTPTCCPTPKL
jgi:hypothetical protein